LKISQENATSLDLNKLPEVKTPVKGYQDTAYSNVSPKVKTPAKDSGQINSPSKAELNAKLCAMEKESARFIGKNSICH